MSCPRKLLTRGNILKRLVFLKLPAVLASLVAEYASLDYVAMIDALRAKTLRVTHENYCLELGKTQVVLKALLRPDSFCIGIITRPCSSFEFLRFLVDDKSFLCNDIQDQTRIQCYRKKVCDIFAKRFLKEIL